MANNVPTEAQDQARLAAYLDRRGFLWCHVPNEIPMPSPKGLSPSVYQRLKRLIFGWLMALRARGLKKGVPDALIFTRPKIWIGETQPIGMAMELKRAKGGNVSEDQQLWLHGLSNIGWYSYVAHGSDDAIREIERVYGK
jgi:hypothetical protein